MLAGQQGISVDLTRDVERVACGYEVTTTNNGDGTYTHAFIFDAPDADQVFKAKRDRIAKLRNEVMTKKAEQ